MNYFADIERYYENSGLAKPKGCTDSEIKDLEESIGLQLPETYKAYLRFMGKDYKGVLRGTDCFINHVADNIIYLPELLKENSINYELAERYLAFFCHQGYMIAWFNLPKENENPKCFYFSEGSSKNEVIEYKSFMEFISMQIMGMAKCQLELQRAKKWWQVWK